MSDQLLTNQVTNATTRFRVLSDDQCDLIYRAALEILARTGVKVHEDEGLQLLEAAGAQIAGPGHALIPASAVEQALRLCPSTVRLVGRDPERICRLERDRSYFGTGSDCPFILDRETGRRRAYSYEDVRQAAVVADALPHMDFHMSLGLVQGVPRMSYDRHQFLAMLEGTSKPLVQTAVDRAGLADQYEMACVIRGSARAFELAPLLTLYAEPTSPLTHTRNATQKLLFAAEKRIPAIYTPCPISGATAPITGAGTLAVALAETLSGIVMAQQKAPGAPIIAGGVMSIMDMGDMIYSYGAPELALFSAALTDVVKRLGLPMFSTAGCSDSKVVDQQAAIEATISILFAALSGANLIHDVGFLESALIGSNELVALADEVIGMAKQIVKGLAVDEEHLALDTIAQVGPAGQYLNSDHTLRHFRKFWRPTTMARCAHEKWVAEGSKTMGERVRERVDGILATHQPLPIPEDQRAELSKIVAAADAQYGQE
jgi:trimethylamine---corrinoid protein Co-methyltransferase